MKQLREDIGPVHFVGIGGIGMSGIAEVLANLGHRVQGSDVADGTNARMGASDWMVVEADESDGTFVKLPADVALVTNIDPEHLDHYGSFDKVREAFLQFVENVPFYGFAVMCLDHPEVQALVGR